MFLFIEIIHCSAAKKMQKKPTEAAVEDELSFNPLKVA